MAKENIYMDTLMGEIPKPVSNELNEVKQELLEPNQYNGKPVEEINIQNKRPFILYHTTASSSEIITAPVVITSLQCVLVVTGNTKSLSASIALNTRTFYANTINTDATIQKNNDTFYMAIPDWLLVKGDRLDSSFSWTAGAGHDEKIIILGYYL